MSARFSSGVPMVMPPFFFEISRIHHAFFNRLVLLKGAGLAQKVVNEGRFTMVDVGNDANIPKI